MRKAKERGYGYISCRIAEGDKRRLDALVSYGFKIVDECATLVMDLGSNRLVRKKIDGCRIRLVTGKDIKTLENISASAFTNSYFYKDKFFKKANANKMHRVWIRNLCRDSRYKVYVAKFKSRIVGFHACLIEGHIGVPKLMAIKKRYRNLGIGYNLLLCSFNWFLRNKAQKAIFRTQRSNVTAVNLYKRMGCKEEYADLTLSRIL